MKWVRPLILFGIGGTLYVLIELIARGRSHWTMFFVGGLAFYLIGCINEHKKKEILMRWQMAAGAGIITGLELISGISKYHIGLECMGLQQSSRKSAWTDLSAIYGIVVLPVGCSRLSR